MNPDTNRFEALTEAAAEQRSALQKLAAAVVGASASGLLRPDGTPVPAHWTVFTVGEHVVIKDYTFKVAYVGETAILFEPVGPVVVEQSR